MFEILGKTNIDFMGKRYIAFAFSGMVVLLGVLGGVLLFQQRGGVGANSLFHDGAAAQFPSHIFFSLLSLECSHD